MRFYLYFLNPVYYILGSLAKNLLGMKGSGAGGIFWPVGADGLWALWELSP